MNAIDSAPSPHPDTEATGGWLCFTWKPFPGALGAPSCAIRQSVTSWANADAIKPNPYRMRAGLDAC